MPQSTSNTPSPLARFPTHIREAHERFRADQQLADLQIVVEAALRDFMPKSSKAPANEPLPQDAHLVEDLGLDSLAVAEIVFFFEDLFQVSIPTPEIMALQTVGDLQAFVARKVAARVSVA